MKDLDFRKFLTEYGISQEEFKKMPGDERKKLEDRFKAESRGAKIEKAGKSMGNLGCSIMLLPILAILLIFIWAIIK